MEALLNQRKFYKTDRNYVFTIDKPSKAKSTVAGGALAGGGGVVAGMGGAHLAPKGAAKLLAKAGTATGAKKKALELGAKAATGIGNAATKNAGKLIIGGIGAGAAIPMGAVIGHAMAKKKLKYAEPYVQGIIDKVKGQEIKRKQYRNLLKGQRAIGVSAHRLFPTAGGK